MAVAALGLSWGPNSIKKELEGKVPNLPTRPYLIPFLRFSKNFGGRWCCVLSSLPQSQLSASSHTDSVFWSSKRAQHSLEPSDSKW